MKVILSFLLILITVAHVLPFNELVNSQRIAFAVDSKEDCIQDSEKEKNKQTTQFLSFVQPADNAFSTKFLHYLINKTEFMHQVESPPPDCSNYFLLQLL